MTAEETYEVWAPKGAVWSPWVAPVLFTQLDCASRMGELFTEWVPAWAQWVGEKTAVILDIPGADAVRIALALARRGMTPVPLFNASPAPLIGLNLNSTSESPDYEAVPMRQLINAMCWGTQELVKLRLSRSETSAPVFLLDSRRLGRAVAPEMFDNRWMLVPQDFPSATFLRERGIIRVLLVHPGGSFPQADLDHVLLRYQEQGLEMLTVKVDEQEVEPLRVPRPPLFRSVFYRAMARLGLRRNSLGGFGAWVPQSGGGG